MDNRTYDPIEIAEENAKETALVSKEESYAEEKMPSVGLHTFLMVLGFMCGALWGILSIAPLTRMKRAIEEGDSYTARENARKIRIFAIIGVVLNVVVILFQIMALNS